MKRQMLFGTMLSVALAIGISAQEPQTPPQGQSQPPAGQTQPPRTTPSEQSSSERTMTLTGCVQAGGGAGAASGAATPGAPGAGASSSDRAGFILTSISPAGSSTPGTAGTSGSAASASSYRLSGGENLQQYVGKRVEVTGTVSGRAGSSATGAAGSTPGAGASESSMATFRVTSVKPATGECK